MALGKLDAFSWAVAQRRGQPEAGSPTWRIARWQADIAIKNGVLSDILTRGTVPTLAFIAAAIAIIRHKRKSAGRA